MFTNYNAKVEKDIVNIYVGEYYATKKDEIICTILGSCVGVCLIDEVNKVYGMNHFLLPGNLSSKKIYIDDSARFGIYSMELLIGGMQKMGADRRIMKAKVFGGAKVLKTDTNIITINEDNIKFARDFLNLESIPILAEDVGGTRGRRIYFSTSDGSVYVEKVKDKIDVEEQQSKLTQKVTKKNEQSNLDIWD